MNDEKIVEFRGRSLDEVNDFPVTARREAGHQIHRVQCGRTPDNWKPMKAVGKGVREIRVSASDGIFRVIYVANIDDKVYVLRCFQKKTRATSKADVEVAKKRYRELQNELCS